MKKILLMSLVLIGCDAKEAPVYANSVDLKCESSWMEHYIHLTSANSKRKGYASEYFVGFDKEGRTNNFSKKTTYVTEWDDDFVTLKLFGKGTSRINRKSLTYWTGMEASSSAFYDCEITEGVQAKAQQWEQEYQEHLNSKKKINTENKI